MTSSRITNTFLLVASLLACLLAMRIAENVFIPLLIAILLTYIMDPLVVQLRRILPVWLAAAVTAIVFLGVLTGFGFIAWFNLVSLTRELPQYQDDLLRLILGFENWLQAVAKTRFTIDLDFSSLKEFSALSITSVMFSTARSTLSVLMFLFMVYLFAILFLASKYYLAPKLQNVFENKKGEPINRVFIVLKNIDQSLRKYIIVKSLISLTVGTGTGLIAALFGVAFPVAWGFLTFLLNFVPTVGSLTSVITLSLFTLVQLGAWQPALGMLICLSALQMITGGITEPALTGSTLNLSLVVVFVSLFFWGWLWGPAGIFLAVPMTVSIKVVLAGNPATSRFAALLENSSHP